MPSKRPEIPLHDILRNIDLALSFVANLSLESFRADTRTVYAVTRCLEIISEASRRLPPELKARRPDIPWDKMSGAGNIYRHDYDDVIDDIVWQTVLRRLKPLRTVIE